MGHTNDVQPGIDQLKPELKAKLNLQTDFGNAFIFAFAGHDTTGACGYTRPCARTAHTFRR